VLPEVRQGAGQLLSRRGLGVESDNDAVALGIDASPLDTSGVGQHLKQGFLQITPMMQLWKTVTNATDNGMLDDNGSVISFHG
jgi:hypothetical protein